MEFIDGFFTVFSWRGLGWGAGVLALIAIANLFVVVVALLFKWALQSL